jgi:hypothetical protein
LIAEVNFAHCQCDKYHLRKVIDRLSFAQVVGLQRHCNAFDDADSANPTRSAMTRSHNPSLAFATRRAARCHASGKGLGAGVVQSGPPPR